MKFVLVDVATADLDNIALTIEGVARNLVDIMPVCKNISILPAAVGSATWDVYFDIPCVVSAAAGGAATTIIVISDGGNYISNFVATTVGQFKGGRDYLISNIATAVTPIIPTVMAITAPVLAGTTSGQFCAARYWFHADKDQSPLNASTVDIITFDVDYAAKAQVTNAKNQQKRGEIANSINAISGGR